jgi:TonB family protein
MNLLGHVLMSATIAGVALGATPPAPPPSGNAPITINQTELPVFPAIATAEGLKHGEARVAIAIDETGRLTDCLIVGYSYRAFADASVAAVKHWRFEPRWIHGIPSGGVANLNFTFETEGAIVNVDTFGDSLTESFFRKLGPTPAAFSACLPRDLDRIPTPVKIVSPVFPSGLGPRNHGGRVTVKFYIDERGRTRLPRVTSEEHRAGEELAAVALGRAAVAAVAQWQFEPPLANGKPAVVLVDQNFELSPPEP